MNGGMNTKEFRSCCGFAPTATAMKLVMAYYVVWCILLSQLPMPWTAFYIGMIGLATCVFALVGVVLKNSSLIFVFFCYALFSIFLLLYLGGYFFFVTIFYGERVKEEFGEWFEDLFFVVHLLDVLCLLIHYYTLGIILKYRTYILETKSKSGKAIVNVEEQVSTGLRSDTNLYDMA